MPLKAFLAELQETGRIRLARSDMPTGNDVLALEAPLREYDALARAELAGEAPPLSVTAASWALVTLYRGCQFLIFRELGAESVAAVFNQPCPEPPSPQTCYSADLAFRFLPDLAGLARGIARDDPLVSGLLKIAREWPLSSVGLRDVGETDPTPFITHPCLRRLYADRILERSDTSRLADSRVAEAVREALGGHPEMNPELAALVDSAKLAGDGRLMTGG